MTYKGWTIKFGVFTDEDGREWNYRCTKPVEDCGGTNLCESLGDCKYFIDNVW